MAPALWALGLGALLSYGVVSWGLQIQSRTAPASSAPVVRTNGMNVSELQIDANRVAQALGAPASAQTPGANAATAEHQWTLLGVVAGSSGKGSALLAVDGQPPKAYLPGQSVAPGWVLHSVGHRLARLAPEGQTEATVTLDLPKLGQ